MRQELGRSAQPGSTRGRLKATTVADWRNLAAAGRRIGPDDARVTIIEFSDFQCPFCADLHENLKRIRERYPTEVAVVYRHFPLVKVHPFAENAAHASERAAEQGRFEAFQSALFRNQGLIGIAEWTVYARAAEITDLPRFQECYEHRTHASRLAEDIAAGERLGVIATPTVLINGIRLDGAPSLDHLEYLVEKDLGK